MRQRDLGGRPGRNRAALVGVLVGLLALPALPSPAGAQDPAPVAPPAVEPDDDGAPEDRAEPDVGADGRAALAEAERAGEDVTLLVAAEEGRLGEAARQLRALGAEVEVVDQDIAYLKATLAPGQAMAALKSPAVHSADVDRTIELDDPVPTGSQDPSPQTPPGAATPAVNPYLPTGDIGAPQFVADNPTFDGRGTVVAIIDSGVDLDSAALAATTTAGQPKVIEWYNAVPHTEFDGRWVATEGRYLGSFEQYSRTWTAPSAGGPFSFGVINEASGGLASSEARGDLDRDGAAGTFGVLQDRSNQDVYVDTDKDGDFTDETPMQDFRDGNRDVGYFGVDNPATPERDRIAFTVGTLSSTSDPASAAPSWVNIGVAVERHGTHVAGIATGHGLFGGAMNGVAPGAQVISVNACLAGSSCSAAGILDGIVYAAQRGADVTNMSIGGLPALNDGNNARAELIDRTIAEYDMQVVLSAGNNGPGANTVGDPSVTKTALSVGASITDDTWRSNYGSDSSRPLGLIPFSSRGPSESGGFKPDVVAPGSAVATIPAWQTGLPIAGTYSLPPGYGMLNGTSMAAPQVAGAISLLVGAHKAANGGARPDPAALRDAIKGSAVPIPGVGVHEQGMGLVDVGAAWARLQRGHSPHAVTATVPSGSPLAAQLATPGVGVGIYERNDMVAGGSDRTRVYTVTRTSGPAGNRVVPIRFVGNEHGTFSASSHVALPLGRPVSVPVRISSAVAGAHSAAMVIDDPSTPGTELIAMNAAFVAEPYVDGVVRVSGTVPRNGTRHFFVAVPTGSASLSVTLEGGSAEAGTGQIRFLRYHPHGTPLDPTDSSSCYLPSAGSGCGASAADARTITNPTPGLWEIAVDARRTSDVADAPFTLTATTGTAWLTPRRSFVGPVAPDGQAVRTIGAHVGAATSARIRGGALSSVMVSRPSIAAGVVTSFPIVVPVGASEIRARIGNPSDPSADLDLALYNCTSGTCVLSSLSGNANSEELVRVDNPRPGNWLVEVDPYDLPSGSATFDYFDSFTSPVLGEVTVADSLAPRTPNESWSAAATASVSVAPAEGRHLTGPLFVVNGAGLALATGTIEMTASAPPTTTEASTDPSPSVEGQAVTITAEVEPPTAAGRVVFIADGAILGSTVVAGGRAQLQTGSLAVGTRSITSRFEAAGAFADSTSEPTSHVVEPMSSTGPGPVAVAGPDQRANPGSTVTLDASGSTHPDDDDLEFGWLQESGPAVVLSDESAARPTFTAPDTDETLTFRLVAVDPNGEIDTDTVDVVINDAPSAAAGPDQRVNGGTTVTLDGSASDDPDGDTLTYAWTQTTGPTVTLDAASTAEPTFTAPPGPATLTFELTVTDPDGANDTDTVTVVVNEGPVADAGPDQRVRSSASVTLDGSASDDPDGDTLTYAWTQTTGPTVTLDGTSTAEPTFTAPSGPAALTFELTVTDQDGATGTDSVTVLVNGAPSADAGADQRVGPAAAVALDGAGSSDPDDDAIGYQWVQTAGPAVTLAGADTVSPTFTAPPSGPASLTFTLTVTDPDEASATDTVTVEVFAPPTADAGTDQLVNPGDEVTLDGAGTTDDDASPTYVWAQDSGVAVDLVDPTAARPTFVAPAGPDVLTFTLTVSDGAGQTVTDQVVITINGLPTADAGPAQTVDQSDTVALDGSASADPDGDDLTYAWTQESGPAADLVGADTATPTFTAPPGPASLVFGLTVTDIHGGSSTASVTITVVPPLTASEEWVVEVYSTFLHRVPDAASLAFWAGRLDAGTSRETIVRNVALSSEATHGPVVTDLYQRLLDRNPGAAERSYWAGRLGAGTQYHWVERTLLASAERYNTSGGTDAAFVSDLYQRTLDRSGADSEIAYWVGRLASGAPRLNTVDALLDTPEARAVRVAEVAEDALGRPATPSELADLGARFRTTRDPRTVAMAAFLLRV